MLKELSEVEVAKREKDNWELEEIFGIRCFSAPKKLWMKRVLKHRVKNTGFQGYSTIQWGLVGRAKKRR